MFVAIEKSLANLLDQGKEDRREDKLQRERLEKIESEGDAVTVYHAAGGRKPVPVQPVGQSQQHLQGS